MECFHNEKEKFLYNKYKEMNLGNCEICQKCKSNKDLSGPVCCWFVGSNFEKWEKRILFVGKNARGYDKLKSLEMVFDDGRELWKGNWPYWSYTREIAKNIFGNESPENIAFTNIVKCNDSAGRDTTSERTMDCCIKENAVIREEIKIIKPTHIIFYTNQKNNKRYDYYIKKDNCIFDQLHILIPDEEKICGENNIQWLEADGIIGNEKYKVLITSHPQFKNKDKYTKYISNWIKNN